MEHKAHQAAPSATKLRFLLVAVGQVDHLSRARRPATGNVQTNARSPVWPLREDAKTELLISADILVDEPPPSAFLTVACCLSPVRFFRRDRRTANRSK
jgi:hypothetical protein